MVSSVDIANFALTRLGANRITSLSDDTNEAIVMNLFYDTTRKYALECYGWSFSLKRASLAADTTAADISPTDYTYSYTLPSDFLSLARVSKYYPPYSYDLLKNTEQQQYVVEDNKILTNLEAPLKIYYTFNQEDTTRFSQAFVKYLYLLLAFEACEEVTQSNTKKDMIGREVKEAYSRAVSLDRMQRPPEQVADSSWLDSRINNYGGF